MTFITPTMAKPLIAWALERHSIYEARKAGKLQPWTRDPILSKYRFCNVYRELDKVTLWVAKNMRDPLRNSDPELIIFWMAVARYINRIESLRAITPLMRKWSAPAFINILQKQNESGPVFGAAYIISTNGQDINKIEYIGKLLDQLYKDRKDYATAGRWELHAIHTALMSRWGFGTFMCGQIIADIKYTPPFRKAPDWWSWSASGPGSERGMNRLLGNEPKRQNFKNWHELMRDLQAIVSPALEKKGMPRLHAQDLQNCLCEFDKYERVRKGEGEPKQLYRPSVGTLL